MKVVLRSDRAGLGKRGDVVEVADGYARNYLLPAGAALPATDGIAAQASAMRRSRDTRDTREREGAEFVAQRLVPIIVTIPARVGREGRLFGSVTPADVVEAVEQQSGIRLDRHKLLGSEPIKTAGIHEVSVRLHPEVEFAVTVEVVATS